MAAEENNTSADDLAAWVREELSLAPQTRVDVAERPGSDPRCSDVVTEVTVSPPDAAPYAFHIERPLRELERMDLVAAIAFGGGH